MNLLGNLIWLIFGGLVAAIGYIVGGIGLCLTIIGIPFGIQSIQLGLYALAPFGKEIVEERNATGSVRMFFNVIWLVLFGWEIALAHLLGGALLAITVIGLPFARQHFKLIPVALFPFSYRLR